MGVAVSLSNRFGLLWVQIHQRWRRVAQPCHADLQDPGQGQGGAPKPICLQEARY